LTIGLDFLVEGQGVGAGGGREAPEEKSLTPGPSPRGEGREVTKSIKFKGIACGLGENIGTFPD
jgi:hypothetical protein